MTRLSPSLLGFLLGTLLLSGAAAPSFLLAQASPTEGSLWRLSAVAGGSYYCIVSRCNQGVVLGSALDLRATPNVTAELGVRWHHCFDCDRFVTGEAGVRFQWPIASFSPFVALGGGVASDPAFFGVEWGPWVAVGSEVHLRSGWSLRLEARGRRIRRGSEMGDVTLGLAHGLP